MGLGKAVMAVGLILLIVGVWGSMGNASWGTPVGALGVVIFIVGIFAGLFATALTPIYNSLKSKEKRGS